VKKILTLFLASACFLPGAFAQYDSPVDYMNYLTAIEDGLGKDYMGYMSAMAHSSARKMERKRIEVLTTVKDGRKKVATLKAYHGETKLRDAYGKYLSILQALLNEDYAKIVDMEEIAEQSYDAMEAFLLAKEAASEKLRVASDSLHAAYHNFAENNQVKIVDGEKTRIAKKLEQTGETMSYYNQVYLIYFKSSKQEGYVISASNSGDVNGVEQNRSTLLKYTSEGLQRLNSIKPFENDFSLVIHCRKLLEFQKNEAEKKYLPLIDYLVKREEFIKFKKAYDNKSQHEKTSADVDEYNKLVSEMNKLGSMYNRTNDELNQQRSKLVDNWSAAVRKFMDTHVPEGT
jgi:NADH dehydrogenase/NADH:ubiquinone oxidoreductase subunit G